MSIAPDRTTRTLGEPAWEIARLYPNQGHWSEEEYFTLSARTNRLIEFSDGFVEVLPMPMMTHQMILLFLYESLKAFAVPRGLGTTLIAGMKVRLWPGKYREPDVFFMLSEHAKRMGEQFWEGADLVIEVVSEDRRHDLEVKRSEYARAGIPECWIIDPMMGGISVLRLEGGAYGEAERGGRIESALLPGFSVDVVEALTPRA